MKHYGGYWLVGMLVYGFIYFAQASLLMQIQQRGRLIVGVKANYPPWSSRQNGQFVGFAPDLAKNIASHLNVKAVFKPVTAANRFQILNQGDVDLLIATVGDTRSRRSMVRMLQPHYYRSGALALARKGHLLTHWSDLIGKRVCLTNGAYYNQMIIRDYRIKPVMLMTKQDAKLALLTNKCVAWIYDSSSLYHIVQQPQWRQFKLALPVIMPVYWSIVFRRDDASDGISEMVSRLLQKMIRQRKLLELAQQWQLPDVSFLDRQYSLWQRKQSDGSYLCTVHSVHQEIAPCVNSSLTLNHWWGKDGLARIKKLLMAMLFTLFYFNVVAYSSVFLFVLFTALSTVNNCFLHKLIRLLTQCCMTLPPLVLLYLVYFGVLGFWPHQAQHVWFSATLVSILLLTIYTASGMTELAYASKLLNLRGKLPLWLCIVFCILEFREAIHGHLVNVVKASAMVGAIAVPNLVLDTQVMLMDSVHPVKLMVLLLVFYYFGSSLAHMMTLRLFAALQHYFANGMTLTQCKYQVLARGSA
ncbi:MAG: Membrane-bound lytic murein transglycosylase F [Candidatus Celerinatantimonas neptuna]|nr:MAG: Membrane-bound lytic murein transglycosylase F [Candidatus Celerinatantimonas neptuna]